MSAVKLKWDFFFIAQFHLNNSLSPKRVKPGFPVAYYSEGVLPETNSNDSKIRSLGFRENTQGPNIQGMSLISEFEMRCIRMSDSVQ